MSKSWKYILPMLAGIAILAFMIMMPMAASAADTIKVGIVLPVTGPQAKFGEIEKQSFDMALEEINGGGGVKGKKLEFLIEDDTGRPEVGRSVVEKLITKDKVIMLGGGSAKPCSLPYQYRFSGQDHRARLGLYFPLEPTGERVRQWC